MCLINERPELVRLSVQPRRREHTDAVITPAKSSRKISDRHNLEYGDPKPGQFGKFRLRSRPCSCRREGADMHLINHLVVARHAPPGTITPLELAGIDDLRCPMGSLRLKSRGRVRKASLLQRKLIEPPRPRFQHIARKIPLRFGLKFDFSSCRRSQLRVR